MENGPELRVKKMAPTFVSNGTAAMQIIPTLYIFVPNLEAAVQPVIDAGQGEWIDYTWNYAFDLSCPDPQQITVQDQIWAKLDELREQSQDQIVMISCDSVAAEREGFYSLYGSLLFLGVLLGVVFVFAAVLIIYYKQISEGYEDQSRFAIMQKVGMTKREIRKSINSQILTVFFLPLILAGVHLAFAFPMLQKLLMLFGLTNVSVICGEAPEAFEQLPAATHAFIGGSGGRLGEILQALFKKNPRLRVVINAVTLETIGEITSILKECKAEEQEIVQVAVSRAKQAGSYHLMRAENPVFVAAFRFAGKKQP